MARSLAQRRYVWRIAFAMGGYILTLLLADYLIDDRGLTGPLAYAAAIVPGLFVASVFWAVARLLIEEQDEYLRMLLVRQTLVATALTLSIATIWGFLESFGLAPHVDAFYISVLWFAGLGVGAAINKLTFGDSGGSCP